MLLSVVFPSCSSHDGSFETNSAVLLDHSFFRFFFVFHSVHVRSVPTCSFCVLYDFGVAVSREFPSKARSIPLRSCFSSLFLLQHHLLSLSSSLFSQISLLFSFMFHPIIFEPDSGSHLKVCLPPCHHSTDGTCYPWEIRGGFFFFSSRSKFSKRVSGLTLPSVFALLCLLYWASSGVDLLQGFPGIWCYKWKTSCG